MNLRLAHLLTRLYPRQWQERYGDEFEVLLLADRGSLGTLANVVCSALCEHLSPTLGGDMNPDPNSFSAILKHPSAFLPLAMSVAALAVIGVAATYSIFHYGHGLVREPDEGTAAHLWQLLMAGQLPVLAFFAIKWLPRAPRPTLCVLVLQAGGVLAAMAPVYFLHL
jgi:hypothetical protein